MATAAQGREFSWLNRLDVSGIHLNANGLTDQIDRQDKAVLSTFARKQADDAFERSVRDLHHRARLNHRTGIVRQRALDKRPNAVDLRIRNRGGLAIK